MVTDHELGLAIMIIVFASFLIMGLGDSEPQWKQCKVCRVYYMGWEEGPNGECPYVHSDKVIARARLRGLIK